MTSPSWLRITAIGFSLACASLARAQAPSDVWSARDANGGIISADGSSVVVAASAGFQLRRTSDGRVDRTLTLPAASLAYDAIALSPDNQRLALTYRASGVTRIEIWSLASGTLVRSIDSGAVRNSRGLSLTNNGIVALFERYAYGDGGFVFIFRVDDGSLLSKQGPFTRNSTTSLQFSPNGSYLAIQARNPEDQSVHVLSTADWTTRLVSAPFTSFFHWAHDSTALWAEDASGPWHLLEVPSGTVRTTVTLDFARYFPNDVTPDNRVFVANAPNQDAIYFVRGSDGTILRTYGLSAQANAGSISPNGDTFTYTTCNNGNCTFHLARMPAF